MNTFCYLPEPEPAPDLDDAVVGVRVRPRCADGHGTLNALFFSDDLVDIGRAKAICGRCELHASCLRDAMEREEPWGVWGGELLEHGRIAAAKRPCGRPPKHPRPILVFDEMGAVAVPAPVHAGTR